MCKVYSVKAHLIIPGRRPKFGKMFKSYLHYVIYKKLISTVNIYYSLCNIKQFGVYITFIACTHVAEEALLAQHPKAVKLADDRSVGHVFGIILK